MICDKMLDHRSSPRPMVLTCKRAKGHEGPCFPGKWRTPTALEQKHLADALNAVDPKVPAERWGLW